MVTVPYVMLEYTIWIEILMVALLIIISYVLRYYFYLRNLSNAETTRQLKEVLEKAANGDGKIDPASFPKKWRRLDIILPLIFHLNDNIRQDHWPQIKKDIANAILLPIARKKYKSRFWMNRLLSTQCFELWVKNGNGDGVYIAKLLDDRMPIIHLHATVAAVTDGTEKLINLVITNMSQRRRLGQTVYLKIFELASPNIRAYVEERLKTEKNIFARATCYKILMTFKEYDATLDITRDLQSSNMDLRLSAMRYMTLAKKNDAIPVLIKLLSNPEWEIRAASNRLLGELHASTAINEITNGLKDKTWWVRVNAANALKSLGEPGLAILHAQDPEKDKYAYETAMHVLQEGQ